MINIANTIKHVSLFGSIRRVILHTKTTLIQWPVRYYSEPPRLLTETVARILQELTKKLDDASLTDTEADAGYIIAHVLGKKTLEGVSQEQRLSASQLLEVERLSSRRMTGMPVQYVLGEWDFRDLTLQLQPPVFIPRPETEELVAHALQDTNVNTAQHGLEIGCGSGAISLALLSSLPQLKMTAVDCSQTAHDMTQHNAEHLGLADRLTLLRKYFPTETSEVFGDPDGELFDFLISNPPYIPTKDMKNLQSEVAKFEDSTALHGGTDGMTVIQDILLQAPLLVKPSGTVWLEVDGTHPEKLPEFLSRKQPRLILQQVLKDFRSISRFCQLCVI